MSVFPNQETQNIFAQGVVNAMALNVFATAMGLIVSAAGAEALEVPPSKLIAGDPAVEELRKAYGDAIVSKALEDVPDAEAVRLAQRVEYYVQQDMRNRYGDWAANIAIEAAPPGDLRTAQEIAKTLSQRDVGPTSPPVEKARAVSVGKMRGRSAAEPVRDTKTGIVYSSKYKAGLAVAPEYGLRSDQYAYFKILQIDKKAGRPPRFVPA